MIFYFACTYAVFDAFSPVASLRHTLYIFDAAMPILIFYASLRHAATRGATLQAARHMRIRVYASALVVDYLPFRCRRDAVFAIFAV